MTEQNPQPAQPFAPTQPAVRPEHKRTTVCGIVGVVFGALGLILSFIPIVNNLAAILGSIGLVLAIIGIVGTFRGKKHGKGLAIAAAVLSALAIVITLAMQAATVKAIDDAVKDSKGVTTSQPADKDSESKADSNEAAETNNAAKGEQDMEGDIEGAHVKIVSAVRSNNDYEGKPTVLVTYEWTNNTTKNNSFAVLTSPKAFQNGTELPTAIYMDSPAGYDANSYLAEVQPGAVATVTLGYVLQDDSPVTVDVTALFSVSDESKVTHTFTL